MATQGQEHEIDGEIELNEASDETESESGGN